MFETLAVFHFEMSMLNVGLKVKGFMLATAAVFQSPMLPYVIVAEPGSVCHEVTAVAMLVFVMSDWEVTWAGTNTSNAKRTKAFDVLKTVAPLIADAPILVVSVASAIASLSDRMARSPLRGENREAASRRRGRQAIRVAPKRRNNAISEMMASAVGAILDGSIFGTSVGKAVNG
jgi:hypothetical protein